jgi:hypothetical protein
MRDYILLLTLGVASLWHDAANALLDCPFKDVPFSQDPFSPFMVHSITRKAIPVYGSNLSYVTLDMKFGSAVDDSTFYCRIMGEMDINAEYSDGISGSCHNVRAGPIGPVNTTLRYTILGRSPYFRIHQSFECIGTVYERP